jgi:hypothetical protein
MNNRQGVTVATLAQDFAVDQGDLQIIGLSGCAQQDDGNSLNY